MYLRDVYKGAATMPNGGLDNCITCWFNARNRAAPYSSFDTIEAHYCTIRKFFPPEFAGCVYCANHPYWRARRDPIPAGPVLDRFDWDAGGGDNFFVPSPDTPAIRRHLLFLLEVLLERPALRGVEAYIDAVVVWQLGELREVRAAKSLRLLAEFDSPEERWPNRPNVSPGLVGLAQQALDKIEGRDDTRDDFESAPTQASLPCQPATTSSKTRATADLGFSVA
ncbi:MAG: hypothetical protein ACYC33_02160 [Thermoleophilia bacterium]